MSYLCFGNLQVSHLSQTCGWCLVVLLTIIINLFLSMYYTYLMFLFLQQLQEDEARNQDLSQSVTSGKYNITLVKLFKEYDQFFNLI